ncbi:integrase catalytic subunit [Flammeovirgaceae bacterium 311]|nr:integrase catalytic subunit [Flammeovirgaceae bacterium 311]
MVEEHGVSHCQACTAVSLPGSSYQYQPKQKDDTLIIEQLKSLVEKHPSIGFWQCYYRLRKKGHSWNHKRVTGSIASFGSTSEEGTRKDYLPG